MTYYHDDDPADRFDYEAWLRKVLSGEDWNTAKGAIAKWTVNSRAK